MNDIARMLKIAMGHLLEDMTSNTLPKYSANFKHVEVPTLAEFPCGHVFTHKQVTNHISSTYSLCIQTGTPCDDYKCMSCDADIKQYVFDNYTHRGKDIIEKGVLKCMRCHEPFEYDNRRDSPRELNMANCPHTMCKSCMIIVTNLLPFSCEYCDEDLTDWILYHIMGGNKPIGPLISSISINNQSFECDLCFAKVEDGDKWSCHTCSGVTCMDCLVTWGKCKCMFCKSFIHAPRQYHDKKIHEVPKFNIFSPQCGHKFIYSDIIRYVRFWDGGLHPKWHVAFTHTR